MPAINIKDSGGSGETQEVSSINSLFSTQQNNNGHDRHYCSQPDYRVLSAVRREFGEQWKHIGYALGLKHSVLKNIEQNLHKVEEQTFKMFEEWIQRQVNCCYCKLISAMNDEGLCDAVTILKYKIKLSKPCGNGNKAERTAKAKIINHQVTDGSESYQTEHDAMVAASSTTDVAMTTSHTQSVDRVAMATTNNTIANSVRSINSTVMCNANGSSVTNCTALITTAATSVTNSSTSISSMTSSTTFSNSSSTNYPKTTSKGQTFIVCFVGCTTAQSDVQSNGEVKSSVVLYSSVSSQSTGNATMADEEEHQD